MDLAKTNKFRLSDSPKTITHLSTHFFEMIEFGFRFSLKRRKPIKLGIPKLTKCQKIFAIFQREISGFCDLPEELF